MLPDPSDGWRRGGALHVCNSQVMHQGLMTRNQRWKKDIQILCAKKAHIWNDQKRGEPDPAAEDRRA